MKNMHDIRTEYSSKPLIAEEMNTNPIIQFTSWLGEVELLGIQDFNAATLSTYDIHKKKVRSRIILIKEITKQGVIFFSNYDSDKGKEIWTHPQVAISIYWPTLFRQVRFEGVVTKTSEAISDTYFLSRPKESQISAIVSKQSSVVANKRILEERYQRFINDSSSISRPANWGGFELVADYWEFWQGRNHRLHDRVCYSKTENQTWTKTILEP